MPVTAQNPLFDFDALNRHVWEAWSRPWAAAAPAPAPDVLPGMHGLKGFLDWMQQAAAAAMTGQAGQAVPPTPAFAGWAMPGSGTAPPGGVEALRGLLGTPAFGYAREQQAQQQSLLRAMLDHQVASARYQELLVRAQAQGAERLQRKLAEPGFQADSLKAMYDLWVDAMEEAYAEVALSDEFREAYAAQANTQMRVRQLQQQQLEQWCREAGLPTRSEVDTLGQRMQELRRELRRTQAAGGARAGAPQAAADVKKAKRNPSGKAAKARPAAKATTTRRKPR